MEIDSRWWDRKAYPNSNQVHVRERLGVGRATINQRYRNFKVESVGSKTYSSRFPALIFSTISFKMSRQFI